MTTPPTLSTGQKRYLRGLAHALRPIILVGGKGVSDALIAELDQALTHHELLKVKLAAGERGLRDAWIAELTTRTGSTAVQRVGNTAALYRPNRERARIVLPR